MSDLFICQHKKKLENWTAACPDGKVYASVSAVRDHRPKHLFWLHAEKPDNQPWVAQSIAEILKK
ncbi:MAG TPA: hypothetical protein VFS17_03020, partial [Methylophilaceae bacterium]|nr:hypothetical protein [Methylophilaceae bacterium]